MRCWTRWSQDLLPGLEIPFFQYLNKINNSFSISRIRNTCLTINDNDKKVACLYPVFVHVLLSSLLILPVFLDAFLYKFVSYLNVGIGYPLQIFDQLFSSGIYDRHEANKKILHQQYVFSLDSKKTNRKSTSDQNHTHKKNKRINVSREWEIILGLLVTLIMSPPRRSIFVVLRNNAMTASFPIISMEFTRKKY